MTFQGITRLERWERAEEYGLYPPREVKSIILQHPNDTTFTEWYVAILLYSFLCSVLFLDRKMQSDSCNSKFEFKSIHIVSKPASRSLET